MTATAQPTRATVTWGETGKADNVAVRRLADTAENRARLEAEAAKDQLPSTVVDMGADVLLLSGGALQTASKIARTQGSSIAQGQQVQVDGTAGTALYTDDGFAEIQAGDIVVAVIDTGIDPDHPAFAGRLVKGWNVVDNNADVNDVHGHGTHVAGIVAGSWDNEKGVGGVAPQVKIMPIKAANPRGSFQTADIAEAIRYAADNGAKVVNMSLGGSMTMEPVKEAVLYAMSKGVLVVAASGNNGTDSVSFPARYEDILAIGSSKDGKRSRFSNGGPDLDLSAPGEAIVAPVPDGAYGAKSGTSMASPYAAGAAALVIARHPDWSVAQVASHMKRAVNDLGATGWDKDFGWGEVNLFKAVYGENLPEIPKLPEPEPVGLWGWLKGLFS